jgi:nucleotide-binding universal stress UspA family protein
MFEKILLPLDGSELAEAAIPYVRDLAGPLKAEVYLLHVCPSTHQNLWRMHRIYLDHVADSLREEIKKNWGPGTTFRVSAEVLNGEPEKVIFDYVQQKGINLAALTSRGASGFRALAMGSVADKVVRGIGIPTLLVRCNDKPLNRPAKDVFHKLILPLDRSDASQISIPYAVELAKKLNASIMLFSMTQTVYAQNLDGMGVGAGVNWDSIDRASEQYTEEYLQGVESKIKAQGVPAEHTGMLGIDPANEILELEKKTGADLVVMATRGRSPVARWAFGSTAEKVLREGSLPLLLIREPHK